ncbi:hypothetical protein APHAL10511_005907 [Amanita phalloides]|nr:hypothetical protein APHAL10511_005907 [Amanita phalloides]
MPGLGRVFVALVLCLISFIAYSSQFFIIWPWYGSAWSIDLLKLLLPFNVLVGMLLWNYYLCVATDPGRVPDNWKPDTHVEGFEVKKLTGKPRYCRTCDKYKPPRAHHCQTCDRCVLRMDHHCPWINNCVGHYNYSHFLRFLFFVDLACSYHIAMVSKRVFNSILTYSWDVPSDMELVFIVLNYVACIPVLLLVGGFSLYHFYLLSGNSTTIEGWEKDRVATLVRRGKLQEVKFPYNLGVRRNIESVLGPKLWLWCWPSRTLSNGLKFELAEGDDLEQSWPPEDPDRTDHKLVLPDSPWTHANDVDAGNQENRRYPHIIPIIKVKVLFQWMMMIIRPRHLQMSMSFLAYGGDLKEELSQADVPDKYVRYIPESDVDSNDDDEPSILLMPDTMGS